MEKKKGTGKLPNIDVDKSKSSLVISFQDEKEETKEVKTAASEKKETKEVAKKDTESKKEKLEKKSSDTSKKEKNKDKKEKSTSEKKSETKKTKKKKKIKEEDSKAKDEFDEESDESLEELKSVKQILNKQVSILLSISAKVLSNLTKRLNQKFFKGKGKIEKSEEKDLQEQEEIKEEVTELPFSVNALIEMNIIFTDNQKRPLYQATKKGFYSQSDEILNKATISKAVDVFQETARKLKKVPVPDKGIYNAIPLNEVLANIKEDEIIKFLNYVRRFPSKYIGKNYRISESFAAWVMSGAPDE